MIWSERRSLILTAKIPVDEAADRGYAIHSLRLAERSTPGSLLL